MKSLKTAIIASLFVIAGLTFPVGGAQASLTARANHDHIKIDFFYNGSEVSVRGIQDPGVDLIVKLTSPDSNQDLKKKGKVSGFLWMNVGEIKFDNVPNLYFAQSSKKVDEILSKDEQDKYLVGYEALAKRAGVSPVASPEEKAKWFDEFVKLKESNKLYFVTDGGFTTNPDEPGKGYYMKFQWPYQAPPGDYLVTVYAVKGGKVIEQATSKVNVEQVGAVKTLADMARKNGAIYGGLSVLVAILAGFGVGLVFGKGGGAH